MFIELNWCRAETKRQLAQVINVLESFGGLIPNQTSLETELEHYFDQVHTVQQMFDTPDRDEPGYVYTTEFVSVVGCWVCPMQPTTMYNENSVGSIRIIMVRLI